MSTQVNTYVLFGLRLDLESLSEEKVEQLDDDFGDSAFAPPRPAHQLTFLLDGMNGKHHFIGRVLARTNDQEHFYTPIELPSISFDDRMSLATQVHEEAGLEFNVDDVKLWVVSHYR